MVHLARSGTTTGPVLGRRSRMANRHHDEFRVTNAVADRPTLLHLPRFKFRLDAPGSGHWRWTGRPPVRPG